LGRSAGCLLNQTVNQIESKWFFDIVVAWPKQKAGSYFDGSARDHSGAWDGKSNRVINTRTPTKVINTRTPKNLRISPAVAVGLSMEISCLEVSVTITASWLAMRNSLARESSLRPSLPGLSEPPTSVQTFHPL
jgi:hypothetical protein